MKYFDFDDGLYETYQKGRHMAPEVREQWMAEIAALLEVESIERVLDLGAGTGRFSQALGHRLRAEVVAVDPSARMLSQVAPGIPRVVGQAEALPFPDRFCDAVFASMVIHHFVDLEVAAAEVRRVLRPRGVFLVRTCFGETLDTPYRRFFPTVVEIEQELLPTTAEVLDAFGAAGLQLREARQVRQRMDPEYRSYAERIRLRAMSPLRMISDAEFDAGMAKLDEFARNETEPVGVYEVIDLLAFVESG